MSFRMKNVMENTLTHCSWTLSGQMEACEKNTYWQVVNTQLVCHFPFPSSPHDTHRHKHGNNLYWSGPRRAFILFISPHLDGTEVILLPSLPLPLWAMVTQMLFSSFVRHSINDMIVFRWTGGGWAPILTGRQTAMRKDGSSSYTPSLCTSSPRH